MAEKILEKEICQTCGAEVRKNTLFCYNCGSAVAPESITKAKISNGLAVDSKLGEKVQTENIEFNKQRITNKLEEPISKPLDLPLETKKSDNKNKPVAEKEYNLKTAAELRQESKNALRKSVEVSWKEPQNSPNIWFLIAALVLTLFAVGVLVAMIYIR